jgi:class 3 adenylate cyclase
MGDRVEAYVVLERGRGTERRVPVRDTLFIGRDTPGNDHKRHLTLNQPEVSRHHLEIRLDPANDTAWAIDTSTNGTRVNGARIERAVPHALRPGDCIRIADTEMWFESERYRAVANHNNSHQTVGLLKPAPLVLIVGDIIGYSTISEYTPDEDLARALDTLYKALRDLLRDYKGTFINYQGDAFFAVWEVEDNEAAAAERAVEFALTAVDRIEKLAPSLSLRDPNGEPIRMGWAVVMGEGAVGSLTGTPMTVLGDATNVAFRISGVAGREGRDAVLVTDSVATAAAEAFQFGATEEAVVKGRVAPTKFCAVLDFA